MTIRTRLTIRFTVIVTVITVVLSAVIYLFSAHHRRQEFDERLNAEAITTLRLFFEVDEVDASLLGRIKEVDPNMPGHYLTVHDANNNVLFNTGGDAALLLHQPLIGQLRQSGITEKWEQTIGDRDVVGFAYRHKTAPAWVFISAIDFWGLEQLNFLLLILGGSCVLVILVAAPAGYFYAGRMLQPIDRMVREVNQLSAFKPGTQRGKRLSTGNERDELERLAVTLNRMLHRHEQSLEAQRNFVASASHELRSPLTALSGQIEVALRKSRTNEEYQQLLHSLADDLNQLTIITNGLLTLAKTDAVEQIPMVAFRLDELVDESITETLKHHPDWVIDLNYDDFPDDDALFNLTGNNNLLRIALVNLLDNACKYSTNHKAELRVGIANNSIVLQCIDHGIGIPSDELDKVFNRFFRAGNVGGILGHGIGLPLARRIAELHGGFLSLASEENKGTVVTLTLPILNRSV